MSRRFVVGLIALLRNGLWFPLLLADPYQKNHAKRAPPPAGEASPGRALSA